jgi:hypothetical protein
MTQYRHVDSRPTKSKPVWLSTAGEYVPMNRDASDIINQHTAEVEAAKAVAPVLPKQEMNPTPPSMPIQGATFERGNAALVNAQNEVVELQRLLEDKKEDLADLQAKLAAFQGSTAHASYVVLTSVQSVTRDGDTATIKATATWGDTEAPITVELPASAVREAVAKKPVKPVARKNAKAQQA